MKKLLAIFILLCTISSFAQSKKEIEQAARKQKQEHLIERLGNPAFSDFQFSQIQNKTLKPVASSSLYKSNTTNDAGLVFVTSTGAVIWENNTYVFRLPPEGDPEVDAGPLVFTGYFSDMTEHKKALYATRSSGIYKSTNDGLSWEQVFDEWVTSICSDSTGIIAGGWDGQLWHSIDEGNSWNIMNQSIINLGYDGAVFDVAIRNNIFLYEPLLDYVMVTTDSGATWDSLNTSSGFLWNADNSVYGNETHIYTDLSLDDLPTVRTLNGTNFTTFGIPDLGSIMFDFFRDNQITAISRGMFGGFYFEAASDPGWKHLTNADDLDLQSFAVRQDGTIFFAAGENGVLFIKELFEPLSKLTTITVEPQNPSLVINQPQQFTAKAYDQLGDEMPDVTFTWAVTEGVGAINATGGFVSNQAGSFTVSASAEGISGTATGNVFAQDQLSNIIVEPQNPELVVGQTQQFTATGYNAVGNQIPDITFTWSVTNGVGAVSSTGEYISNQTGSFTVSASAQGITGTSIGNVAAYGQLNSITVEPQNSELVVGKTQQFSATGYDIQGNQIPGLTFTWAVTNGVGAISSTGEYFSNQTGSFTVSASAQGINGTATGNVAAYGQLNSITVEPQNIDLTVGQNQQFTATGYDEQNNTVPIAVTWSATGGTITQSGVYTAGTEVGDNFSVTATLNEISGTATVNISNSSNVMVTGNVPEEFKLFQNYPNPFNPVTAINFNVKETCNVTLKVVDLLGQEVAVLTNRQYTQGMYKILFDAHELPSGQYFYVINMGEYFQAKVMTLLK